jgi:hypothetical protein
MGFTGFQFKYHKKSSEQKFACIIILFYNVGMTFMKLFGTRIFTIELDSRSRNRHWYATGNDLSKSLAQHDWGPWRVYQWLNRPHSLHRRTKTIPLKLIKCVILYYQFKNISDVNSQGCDDEEFRLPRYNLGWITGQHGVLFQKTELFNFTTLYLLDFFQ